MLPLQRPPERICILRLSALGDVTHVVPVIRAIRAQWPRVQVTWIIGKPEHRLLHRLDDVEFIVFDKQAGWQAIRELRRQLDGRRFDVLLHMQVALRANALSRLINAQVRLGWNRERSRDRHYWFVNQSVRPIPRQHQVEGFLEFARSLGIAVASPAWNLPVAEEDRDWAARMLADERPVLMISACSSHPLRNWRSSHYASVADHAANSLGMHVVLIGGPSDLERRTGQEIEAAMTSRVTNLIGRDTLTQSMALLERAAVVVSPDSGPAHIASALGTPVIGLYAATWSRRSGPYNSLHLCVDRFAEAARKFRGKEPEELRWGTRIEVPGVMDLITPADVIHKLEFATGS